MPSSDVPLYLQLAATLRERIQEGVYSAGKPIPFEAAICDEHGVGRMTVRRALAVLREEGLIRTKRGGASVVRAECVRETLILQQNDRLIGRMPSREERSELSLDVGVPLLEVHRVDGTTERFAADRVEIIGH